MKIEEIEEKIGQANSHMKILQLALWIAIGWWRDWRNINGVS